MTLSIINIVTAICSGGLLQACCQTIRGGGMINCRSALCPGVSTIQLSENLLIVLCMYLLAGIAGCSCRTGSNLPPRRQ